MQGQVVVWFLIICLIFVMGLLYTVFTYPMTLAYTSVYGLVNDSSVDATVKTNALQALDYNMTAWYGILLFFIFMCALWAYAATQKKEPIDAYY